jgi:hypothetical protein
MCASCFATSVLPENGEFEISVEILQLLFVGAGNAAWWNFGNLGDDFFYVLRANGFLAFVRRLDFHRRPDFVDHIDGFIGQFAVVNMFGRKFHRCMQRGRRIMHPMMLFIVGF